MAPRNGLWFCVFDWDDLKVFLAAYREGTIGRAAQVLGISGSTVSRRLTALEEALGQTLFMRSPDGLMPTEAGRNAWSAAEETERVATRVESAVASRDEARGKVCVSLSPEILYNVLLPRWAEFSRAYPRISVDFTEDPGLADLERWEADIAVRAVRPERGDKLVVTRLRDSALGLFGARSLLERQALDPADEAALQRGADERWPDWPWIGWLDEYGHLGAAQLREHLYPSGHVVLRAGSMETMRLAAAAGVGLVILPRYFGLVTPTLVALPAPELPGPRPVFLVSHSAIRHTPRVAAVWEFLLESLRGDDAADLPRGRAALEAAYRIDFGAPES